MTLQQIVSLSLQASLFVLVLSIGLQSRWSEVLQVFRRPALLLRAVLAVNIIVPAVTVMLCLVLPIAPWTRAGLVMMAVSPLAPFAPLKMQKAGVTRAYVIGTYAALMLAAIVIVPVTAILLKPIAPRGVLVPVAFVAAFVLKTVILPLAIGITANTLWEAFSGRAASLARLAAFAIIVPVALIILVRVGGEFPSLVGDGTLTVIAAMVATALAAGYVLGGPDPATRKALGEAAATRHPGLAAAIAQLHSNDGRVLATIVLFLVASSLFSALYARLMNLRSLRRAQAA